MGGTRRWRAIGLGLGVLAAAFLLRIANLGFVFVEGRVRFPSGRDELYHVRKIVYQVARFPMRLDFDPYVSFPFGAVPIWPPFLDWGIAAAVRLLAGPADALAVERLIVWIPPLLGALTVAALGALGRRHLSPLAGLVAGLLLAVMHAHHVHSQLGQVDHQVVLGLCAVLLLAAAMAWLGGPGASRARGFWAIAVGFVIAVSLLVSPGALLQILPIQAAMSVWVLAGVEREEAVARARSTALAHAVAGLLVAPACFTGGLFAELGAYSPLVLSRFQPLWLCGGAVSLAVVAEVWKRGPAFASRAARVGAALALAGVGAALAVAWIPALRPSLAHAAGWFTREDALSLSAVMEVQPLFFPSGRFDAGFALGWLTPGFFLFPLAWLWLVSRRGLDPNARPEHAVLLVWSGALFVLALAQQRFANVFAPGLALTLGAAVAELDEIVTRRGSARVRLALRAAVAAALVAVLTPAALDYYQLFASSRFALAQERAVVPPYLRRKATVESAARFLRAASPPTRGFLDATVRPEYGVLTSWDDGHLVRYRAERPTVQDNFGSFADRRAYDLAGLYFDAEDEEAAYRIALELGARYTVATREGSGQNLRPSAHSVGQRLWRRLGNGAGPGSPALAHHRLVWLRDPPGRDREVEEASPDRVAVFGIVPGALITGAAGPAAPVSFALALRTRGRRVWYRARVWTSPQGRYEIRLPYPTDAPVSPEVQAAGLYRVQSGDRSAVLELREADVQAGGRVNGPDLRQRDAS